MATLGERVAILQGSQPSAMELDVQPPADGDAEQPSTSAPDMRNIKADSLSVLLVQALRAEDRALLERCLAVGDERTIAASVRLLPPADAAAFLGQAVALLQSRPARARQLAAWLRALLLHHTAYLMAAPGVQAALAALYQTVTARVALYQPLLSLSGRLDLLTAQLPAAGAGQDGAAQDAAAPLSGPQVLYEESDGEGVAVEDALAGPPASQGESDDEQDEESGQEDDDSEQGSEDRSEEDESDPESV